MTNREELARVAQQLVNEGTVAGGTVAGFQVVVVVMDETMEYVGVGSNLVEDNLKAVLWCALNGEDRIDHKG
jgi:hypothetical protein